VGIRETSGSGPRIGGDRPLRVDVITYAPTIFYHCQHCEVMFGQIGVAERVHREQARDSLPEDLGAEFAAVAEWIHRLLDRHGRRIDVRVIDAASLQGVWKSLRFGTRSYPAVVVAGEDRYIGPDLPLAEVEIERRLAAAPG
jgi:hypothetical protein